MSNEKETSNKRRGKWSERGVKEGWTDLGWGVSQRRLESEMSFLEHIRNDQRGEEAKSLQQEGAAMSDPSIGYAL